MNSVYTTNECKGIWLLRPLHGRLHVEGVFGRFLSLYRFGHIIVTKSGHTHQRIPCIAGEIRSSA